MTLEGGCQVSDGAPLNGQAIALRLAELGASAWTRPAHDQVLYVLRGQGTVRLGDRLEQVAADTGLYVPAGQPIAAVRGPLACACVDTPAQADPDLEPVVVRVSDRPARPTGDRWYRVLIEKQVTQFVGGIPPGRAPDHFHPYEEVLVILAGRGVLWAGRSSAPIAQGSCVYLPRGQLHCLENTGPGELRLVGVFYPAGSPAVRYSA